MHLHGCKGCGSTAIEALLELAGVDYDRDVFEWEDDGGWTRLRAVNPIGQVPLLVLDDGTTMTETAAIALWLANAYPAAKLLPDDAAARALAYRWTVFFATNVYQPIGVGDFPERWVDTPAARDDLKAHTIEATRHAWHVFEAGIAPSGYLLGDTLSVLDVYVAMIARWRPGRAWVAEHCPKAMAAILETERHPVVGRVWARNFAAA